MIRWLCTAMLVSCMCSYSIFSPSGVLAQKPFPSRHLTYLVVFDPGGQSDREARRQQPLLMQLLGQPVIIEYKVGAGGATGWKYFSKKSRADGHTFAGFNLPHVILQPSLQKVGYATDDLTPIALFQRTPIALAVLSDSPFKTLEDFMEAARNSPGKMTVGGSSIYSGSHLAALRMQKMLDVKVSYIPFTGSSALMAGFMGGHLGACLVNSDDLALHRDKIRALAFATEQRFFAFPQTPTFRELGHDLIASVERGVCVPSRTPKEVVLKLEKVFLEVLSNPQLQLEMKNSGSIPLAMGVDETREYMQQLSNSLKELTTEFK